MATTRNETYADWLRAKMEAKGFTQRSLARVVAEISGSDPEVARRSIRRYLKGMVPLARTRKVFAQALGTGDDLGPNEAEAEED
jgi:hypothetical protein